MYLLSKNDTFEENDIGPTKDALWSIILVILVREGEIILSGMNIPI